MRLAGWDLSVQGRVAPKTTLLLYLFLVEVPPNEEHTIVLNAKGTPAPKQPSSASSNNSLHVFSDSGVRPGVRGRAGGRN